MNEKLKMFLLSLVIFPAILFGLFFPICMAIAFITWDWYSFFHNVDYLLTIRVCCGLGWVISIIFGILLIDGILLIEESD